jgi:predicted O-methyltransferase YrrM
MTDAQARRLWDSAHRLRPGDQIVEIGSYHGRSTIVLASAAPDGTRVVAIDPHAGNHRGPQQIHGTDEHGKADNRAFRANLARSGLADRVRHVERPSSEALDRVEGDIELLYIDGAHGYRFAEEDVRRWGARVAPGGMLLIHDAFSSIGVTGALARRLFLGRRFRYVDRERSLAEYRRSDLSGRARVCNALRQARELRWFTRNIVLKVAIAAPLRPVRRFLDPHDEGWPY